MNMHFWSRVLVVACLLAQPTASALAEGFQAARSVLAERCMSCHDSSTREGGIDLSPLLLEDNASYGKFTKLWIKLEEKVVRGEMPPKEEEPLTPGEQESIRKWFQQSFVLRDGKSHIGRTPLRRLTRYEFENTLEDVLSIRFGSHLRDGATRRIARSKIETIVPSDIPGESGFENDAVRMETLRPPLKELAAGVDYALSEFSKDPDAMKAVLGREKILDGAKKDIIRPALVAFLRRAYRGKEERLQAYAETYFNLYHEHVQVTKDANKSLRHVLKMILLSPEFLYRYEESKNLDRPYPVSGIELATRLSYFLWSAPPDRELLQLGRDGDLLNDDVLRAQVSRMLNSPKRIALSKNFAGQWLGFNEILSNDNNLVDDNWNQESYDEALYFFDELIKTDRSLLELIESDWIYKKPSVLSSPQHGYEPIDPGSIRNRFADVLSDKREDRRDKLDRYNPPLLVKTKNDREGGIITSAAIMRLTASKNRTSPIRRGVWVLNTIIGKDLESPPNVPSLEQSREALNVKENPSVAELIKQHTSKPECVACHKEIDPLGLGLENFGPTGQWRTVYADQAPIESTGVMPNGKSFQTPREMKRLLLDLYQDEVSMNFVEQMLAYALGRKTEPFDRVSLDLIMRRVKADGYKVNTVIEQIVLSKQFRYRQDQ